MTPGISGDASGSAPESSFSAATTHSASGSKGSSDGGGGATTSSSSVAIKKGPWTAAEDAILMEYVRKHGEGSWNAVQKNSGLSRCGKSCRLRWANHLRPNLKKGPFSPDEERLILELHSKMGNKWARMAAQLPGRTDNEIKNYWNTRIKRRQRAGLPLYPPDIQHQAALHHRPSAAPPPLSDHKALYSTSIGATPLSLFDTINFPGTAAPPQAAATTPLLGLGHHQPPPFLVASSAGAAGHQQRAKRFREDDLGSFSLPFTTSSLSPPPSWQTPLFHQFNSVGGYVDLNPPPSPQQQSFSVKMELPSSQLFPEPSRAVPGGGSLPLGRSNAELLDAWMRDTHAVGGGEGKSGNGLAAENGGGHHGRDGFPTEANPDEAKWVKWNGGGGAGGELPQELILGTAGGKWDDSNRHHHPTNAMSRRGAAEDAGSVDDDLSALLALIPMAAAAAAAEPREWYNSNNSGEVEVSNGQSSGVTDDNVGLEMQQLASSLSMAAEDHSWSIGSCHWHSMPGA